MLPALLNPYQAPTDFQQLALDVLAFAPHLVRTTGGGATIDWKDDGAVRALTAALLKRDFELEVELPGDRLCPTVPSRHEYVLFVLRLALLTSDRPSTSLNPPSLVGLDIGTGASCIYPLLAVRTFAALSSPSSPSSSTSPSSSVVSPTPTLRMLGTDIDPISLSVARRNVSRNQLEDEVELFEVSEEGEIFPSEMIERAETIDFTMCNPPFYASSDEIASSLAAKELEPFAVCTASQNELITTGGEVSFVSGMIVESLAPQRRKIRWFTSLLGKYSSLPPLVALLKSLHLSNYAVTALAPHGRTTRWVIAWSLGGRRFPAELLYPSPFPFLSATSLINLSVPPPTPFITTSTASTTLSTATPSTAPTTRFLPPSLLPCSIFVPAASAAHVREALEAVLRALDGNEGGGEGGEGVGGGVEKGKGGGEERTGRALDWRWEKIRLGFVAGEAVEMGGATGEEGGSEVDALIVQARENVWSRGARRAAARRKAESTQEGGVVAKKGVGSDGVGEGAAFSSSSSLLLEMRVLVLRPSSSSSSTPTSSSSSSHPLPTAAAPPIPSSTPALPPSSIPSSTLLRPITAPPLFSSLQIQLLTSWLSGPPFPLPSPSTTSSAAPSSSFSSSTALPAPTPAPAPTPTQAQDEQEAARAAYVGLVGYLGRKVGEEVERMGAEGAGEKGKPEGKAEWEVAAGGKGEVGEREGKRRRVE